MNKVYEILSELGYSLKDCGSEYRTSALYREGDNETSLRVYKDSGKWHDFKENRWGSLQDLVKLTLGTKNIEEAKGFLEKRKFSEVSYIKSPTIEVEKTFHEKELSGLISDHSYWERRGIESSVVSLFEGGVLVSEKMARRYVFPIYNSKKKIVGVTGRDITGNNRIKWKHLGDKVNWIYPAKYNVKILKQKKEIYLVESIGDMLSLWQAGIKNTLVTFGLNISPKIISFIIKINPNKIYISFNNDSGDSYAGNKAAKKVFAKLTNFFDSEDVEIKLPPKNDFGEMTKEEILKWVK
jgi:hypothetical protein